MRRPWLRAASAAALCAASLLAAGPLLAQDRAQDRAQVASFFDAGAQAYEAGQYLVAAEAFMKAHELLPSPSLQFSAAQAYRRHYLTHGSDEALRQAVALYRAYLAADPKGKRREDALAALSDLAPLEARLPSAEAGGAAPAPPAPAASGAGTRLLLSARAEGAQVSVDGGPFVAAPAVVHVEPGPRAVRVRAAGHFEEQVTVRAVAGELMPLHLALRPKPARLTVRGTAGARVAVDGQVRATLPAGAPLSIEPGERVVTVTLLGHEPFQRVIAMQRDQALDLLVELPPTPQRIAAWAALATGIGGAIASGTLTGLALSREEEAKDLRALQGGRPLVPAERERYNGAVMARDDLARAAAITGGAAVLTAAVGLGLFIADRPEPPPAPRRDTPSAPSPGAELTIGLLSAGLRGTF